ncbi:MAG: hypothetical protein JXR69_06665 [Candidatus Delongbacteria bacterium]|nr:hypothetical protein [Candidatus Delongbacteria bacterium]
MTRYYFIVLMILLLGVTYTVRAESGDDIKHFGSDTDQMLLAENNLDDITAMPDDDRDFEFDPPGEKRFEHGKKGRGMRDKNISPELETKISNTLKEHFPELYNKSLDLKKNHPLIYRKLLKKLRKHIRRTKEPKEEKKNLIAMIFEESEVDILIQKFKNTENEKEKAELKDIIRKKLSDGFDKRENIEKKVINRIEKNIEKKKKNHDERIKNKEKLINEHLEKLLK